MPYIYDASTFVKNYLFGTDSPSAADYNLHIRATTKEPEVMLLNAQRYMAVGGGRYAYASLFSAVTKFFQSNAFESRAEPYTWQEVSARLGLTPADTSLTVSQYGTDVRSADYFERAFIFGGTKFELVVDNLTFSVSGDVKQINNLEIRPLADSFGFQSPTEAAQYANAHVFNPILDRITLAEVPCLSTTRAQEKFTRHTS